MSSQPRLRSLTLSLVLLVLFGGCAADVTDPEQDIATVSETLKIRLPAIPPELAVPAGNRLAFSLPAEGVQIYECKLGTTGNPAWTFRAPEAELKLFGHVFVTHYAGPTWEAIDGSTVVGTRVAGVTVDTAAIPWLLLKGTSHTGHGLLSSVSYIQRLKTTGGLAPSSGCDTGSVGAVAEVPYTATYAFYMETCTAP